MISNSTVLEGGALKRLVRFRKGESPCWEWQGGLQRDGHPRKVWFNRNLSARRWIYQLLLGPIPKGKVVDMTCGNRICVNVAHMRVVREVDSKQNSLGTKVNRADAAEIRLRLADPRARLRVWRREMIANVCEEFGMCRRSILYVMSNRRQHDPSLPVGVFNIINHYKANPPNVPVHPEDQAPEQRVVANRD